MPDYLNKFGASGRVRELRFERHISSNSQLPDDLLPFNMEELLPHLLQNVLSHYLAQWQHVQVEQERPKV